MNTAQLTKTINNRISELKNEVRKLPTGGGLEVLKIDLKNIEITIGNLIQKINDVEYSVTGLDPNRF